MAASMILTSCDVRDRDNKKDDCSHKWVDATCTEPKTCKKCGDTKGKALGHQMIVTSNFCTVCGEFEYNLQRAVWGAYNTLCEYFNNLADEGNIEGYEILNVYYMIPDQCYCATCDPFEYKDIEKGAYGDPYVVTAIFYRVDYGWDEREYVDLFATHKSHEEGTDIYYRVIHYNLAYWFQSTGNEIDEIYAEDVLFHYKSEDLTRVDIDEWFSIPSSPNQDPESETNKEYETETEIGTGSTAIGDPGEYDYTECDQTVYVNNPDSAITLRASNYEAKGSIPHGTELRRIGISDDASNYWSKVIYDEQEYFVASKFLTTISDPDEGFVAVDKTVVVNDKTGSLNIRNIPAMEGIILGWAIAGEEIHVVAENTETGWYKIEFIPYGDTEVSYGYIKSAKDCFVQ